MDAPSPYTTGSEILRAQEEAPSSFEPVVRIVDTYRSGPGVVIIPPVTSPHDAEIMKVAEELETMVNETIGIPITLGSKAREHIQSCLQNEEMPPSLHRPPAPYGTKPLQVPVQGSRWKDKETGVEYSVMLVANEKGSGPADNSHILVVYVNEGDWSYWTAPLTGWFDAFDYVPDPRIRAGGVRDIAG